jgi:AbrB family looped-hinge helix DNA binding protein
MKSTITSKGQITIPIKIRRRLNLKPGEVLEFDENAPYLKAIKSYSAEAMYSTIGCCRDVASSTSEEWLDETRGRVELPEDKNADSN